MHCFLQWLLGLFSLLDERRVRTNRAKYQSGPFTAGVLYCCERKRGLTGSTSLRIIGILLHFLRGGVGFPTRAPFSPTLHHGPRANRTKYSEGIVSPPLGVWPSRWSIWYQRQNFRCSYGCRLYNIITCVSLVDCWPWGELMALHTYSSKICRVNWAWDDDRGARGLWLQRTS